PHLFNFEARAAAFKEAGALQVAADDSELQLCVTNLLGDERQRLDLVTRASNLLQLNRGAVNKSLACLAPWLPKERSA
ncbi:MAG: 3-deoxy-D-manno-octulosonic acid transferase, partial [Proteobacteria bacterium]|nr:3-deoxy-D-manno-octulosonic acid transferase [Pseudomonadota bacterium]